MTDRRVLGGLVLTLALLWLWPADQRNPATSCAKGYLFDLADGIGVATGLRDGVCREQIAGPHVHIKLEETENDGDQGQPNVIWLYDGLMSGGHELRHTLSKDDLLGRTSVDIARLCLAAVGSGPALHVEMLDPILRPERSLLDGARVVRYGTIPAACARQEKTLSLDRQFSQSGDFSMCCLEYSDSFSVSVDQQITAELSWRPGPAGVPLSSWGLFAATVVAAALAIWKRLRPRTAPANTILFMAANPVDTDERALGEQERAIRDELVRAGHRDRFVFVTRWAAQPLDLLREMVKLKPTVVHFCGGRVGGSRGAAPPTGVYFQGTDGRAQLVSGKALAEAFAAVGSVKLVVLDACYSAEHADSIATYIDCVVGMAGEIVDQAATSFSIALYGGLGEKESVAAAFKQGCAAIGMVGAGDPRQPKLRVRQGVDPSQIILADPR
jgi:hypothetical protein